MGTKKPFDRELYEENNGPAISAVLTHIHSVGLFAAVNEDLYGPDIILYSGFRPISYVEVEVKLSWTASSPPGPDGQAFPYSTVNLPERKGKYLRKRLPIEYWILRADLQVAMIIPDHALDKSQLREVPNRLVSSGERFYQVPIDLCIVKEL